MTTAFVVFLLFVWLLLRNELCYRRAIQHNKSVHAVNLQRIAAGNYTDMLDYGCDAQSWFNLLLPFKWTYKQFFPNGPALKEKAE